MTALVLALALVLAVAVASATTITITHQDGYTPDSNNNAETYHAYKIFDAETPSGHETNDNNVGSDIDTTVTGFKYTIAKDSAWYDAVEASGYFDISVQASPATSDIVTLKGSYTANETTAKAIAAALAPYTVDKAASGGINYNYSLTLDEATSVNDGYYLIISSLGERLVLATTDIEIKEKNTYPGVDKTEKDADVLGYVGTGIGSSDTVDVAVGDTINYKISVTVPATANQAITVKDTMSEGLTFAGTAASLTAKIGANAYDGYNWVSGSASGWEVTIPANDTTKGKTIDFFFDATVNANAVKDSDKENEVELDYSNFEQHDTVPYELVNAGIHKYDGNTNADLAGVEFELRIGSTKVNVAYNSTDNYYYPDASGNATITTGSDGKVTIRGLDNDKTYVLHETQPLAGYNTLASDVNLTLTVDPAGATDPAFIEVENNKGTELPSTGGIGTTIFYVLGGLLVVGAAVILVARRKASN